MGGSSSQSCTDPPRSPINAFPIEELYTLEFSESLQENTSYWQAPNTYEAAGEQVAASPAKNKKKATRNRQKRMIESDDAPRQTPWTTEEEIALAKGWLVVYENSKDGNVKKKQGFWCEESGAGDEDYVQRAMIHYEIDTGIPFKLRHCWEILKDHPKWQEIALPKFSTRSGGSKRRKSSGSSSFNTKSGEASINLNTNVGDNDEDEVQEVCRI
ncbi:ribonuclease H-like domain-containing protein [Tanacetum coccineum]